MHLENLQLQGARLTTTPAPVQRGPTLHIPHSHSAMTECGRDTEIDPLLGGTELL